VFPDSGQLHQMVQSALSRPRNAAAHVGRARGRLAVQEDGDLAALAVGLYHQIYIARMKTQNERTPELRGIVRTARKFALVGNEGIVGIALFMGGQTMPNRAVVQSEGQAYRMKGQALNLEFGRAKAFQHLLLRYTLALLSQMARTAGCFSASIACHRMN